MNLYYNILFFLCFMPPPRIWWITIKLPMFVRTSKKSVKLESSKSRSQDSKNFENCKLKFSYFVFDFKIFFCSSLMLLNVFQITKYEFQVAETEFQRLHPALYFQIQSKELRFLKAIVFTSSSLELDISEIILSDRVNLIQPIYHK